jgi:hypothetical protein
MLASGGIVLFPRSCALVIVCNFIASSCTCARTNNRYNGGTGDESRKGGHVRDDSRIFV